MGARKNTSIVRSIGPRRHAKLERCEHVRGKYFIPGWGCCGCGTYNGYQRELCRACGHPACYDRESDLGREAAAYAAAGTDRSKLIRLMEESSE
jgi:hypothetical protein